MHPSLIILALLASVSAFAGPKPEIEADSVSRARVSRFELDLFENTIRDAKGNRIKLSATKAEEPTIWAHLDMEDNKIPGTSTAKAYATMDLKAPAKPVIVAVIDSGVDIAHPDLAGMIWQNEKEAAGVAGVDDDGNGYIDDINGWNFIGNKDGTNLGSSNLEFTREVARLRAVATTRTLSDEETAYLAELEKLYSEEKTNADAVLVKYTKLQADYLAALKLLKDAGLTEETLAAVQAFTTKTAEEAAAKTVLLGVLARDRNASVLKEIVDYYTSKVNFHLNLAFNPSSIIGDNADDLYERGYGNNDVKAIGSEHGTHCSGIIGALRENGIGMNGQSNFLKIMPVRAVPDGDERDKDIANAIRYAVDNGATVISMSFGKQYSPGKAAVDSAVAYAWMKGVLLVHAAGNSALDIDVAKNFPTAKFFDSRVSADNWIEVGASSINPDENLPADFSNYGQTSVDLFAPGKDIYSTTPDGTYSVYSGTSMATPEVAGIAALVLSQRPELTGQQVKRILTSTVTTFSGLMVNQPSEEGAMQQVLFSSLSSTGGVVNALRALKQ